MHVRKGSDQGENRVLNHDLPLRLGCGQVFEDSMEILRIRESSNAYHLWEDLYAPAFVDEVLQGHWDSR